MFVSLLVIVANYLNPRNASTAQFISGLLKLSIGILLGFAIILLYGVGFPGLRYLFMIIGIGGILHLVLSGTQNQYEPTS